MDLNIDCFEEEKQITGFIQTAVKRLNKKGVLIGLSGGVCSTVCAYLCVRALGEDKVVGVFLPEKDNNPVNIEHAKKVAEILKIRTINFDLTPILDAIGVYDLFKHGTTSAANRESIEKSIRSLFKQKGVNSFVELYADLGHDNHSDSNPYTKKILSPILVGKKHENKLSAFSATKIRLRMLLLSYFSNTEDCLLVGTTEKSEITTGFYDKFGDGVGDIRIISHLYKTQVRQLASYLNIPEEIIKKPASSDVFAGISNEFFIGVKFEQLDQILYGLENKMSDKEIIEDVGVNEKVLKGVKNLMKRAELKENAPYEVFRKTF